MDRRGLILIKDGAGPFLHKYIVKFPTGQTLMASCGLCSSRNNCDCHSTWWPENGWSSRWL